MVAGAGAKAWGGREWQRGVGLRSSGSEAPRRVTDHDVHRDSDGLSYSNHLIRLANWDVFSVPNT